ncbi:MAG: hypothetical protein NWP91_06160 [Rickettsiaceae bacterium]|nr:hypothetical protein [Rickettsiaceae bacterium]
MDKLKQKVYQILACIIIIYGVFIIFLYQSYQDKAEIQKATILHDYYKKISEVSVKKINSLTQQISSNIQNNNISIKANNNDLEVCDNKCINYNLFRFGASIDQYIPEFIYYKIELNNKFLYSNAKYQNYQIEKIYHLNDYNQFNISVAIDKIHLSKVNKETRKPFWIILFFTLGNILLLYIIAIFFFNNFDKEYKGHYQKKYKEDLRQLKLSHSKELRNSKDYLMNKIWNLNFHKQKDLEINCLLAKEANKLSITDGNLNDQDALLKDSRLQNSSDKIPCSIILYQENKLEEINVAQLIDLFKDRFNQENDNILVKITGKAKVVYFSSKAALYQIIYSVISYLIFIINKQSPATQQNITLIVDNTTKTTNLYFEYDGFPVVEEKELFKMSNYFFKTHANPFLLNINQVFNILRINGFNCNVSYNVCNTIVILQKEADKNQLIKRRDNVIHLSSFTEKNK